MFYLGTHLVCRVPLGKRKGIEIAEVFCNNVLWYNVSFVFSCFLEQGK